MFAYSNVYLLPRPFKTVFRGFLVRKFLYQQRDAALTIQRIFRGYWVRKIHRQHTAAIQIQRVARGFLGRLDAFQQWYFHHRIPNSDSDSKIDSKGVDCTPFRLPPFSSLGLTYDPFEYVERNMLMWPLPEDADARYHCLAHLDWFLFFSNICPIPFEFFLPCRQENCRCTEPWRDRVCTVDCALMFEELDPEILRALAGMLCHSKYACLQ